jgi:hypothetical protein
MQPIPAQIPVPELLDPDRLLSPERDDFTLDDHRELADRMERAIQDSCGYGRQLWAQLQTVRGYLLEYVPPRDDDGWATWVDTYAHTTSVLAGARGDSGHGLTEARVTAQQHRG